MYTLIKNPTIVNEGICYVADVLIKDEIIFKVDKNIPEIPKNCKIIDATGLYLFPGIIDTHVHFREPGITHKAEIFTESRAAAAGGVTSFIDMPNTIPPTTTKTLLEEKFKTAADKSLINYSFYLGATTENIEEIINADVNNCAAIKLFLGSSTGNLAIKDINKIEEIFKKTSLMISLHCEDDTVIKENLEKYKNKFGENIPIRYHEFIRSEEACLKSTIFAKKLSEKFNTKIHILHISTQKECEVLLPEFPKNKDITSEVCINYLWFNSLDYDKYGTKIKCNPSIKNNNDKQALFKALKEGIIDIVSTDHAPHTIGEKNNNYCNTPSGMPSIQHSLQMMLELYKNGHFSLPEIAKFMCHNPAQIFNIKKRGFIREDNFADLVLTDLKQTTTVTKENILYKCGWSPLEGYSFNSKIIITFVNGKIVYNNGKIIEEKAAKELKFDRK